MSWFIKAWVTYDSCLVFVEALDEQRISGIDLLLRLWNSCISYPRAVSMLCLGLRFAEAWLDLTGWSGPSEQCSVEGQLRCFFSFKTISCVQKLSLCVNFGLAWYYWGHVLSLVDSRHTLWWFRMKDVFFFAMRRVIWVCRLVSS